MNIEIETNYIPLILAFDDLPEGVSKKILPSTERRGIGYESIAIGIFSFVSGVSASIFANWLYDKIKDKPPSQNKD